MENLPDEDLKISTVKPRLLAGELKLKHRAVESVTQNVVTAFATKMKFKNKFNGKCNNSGKYGHKKIDCRVKINSHKNWSELYGR